MKPSGVARAAPLPLPPHALALQGVLLAIVVVGLERAVLPLLAPLYVVAFAIVVHAVWRGGGALEDPRALLLWAFAFRITLFPTLPDLSDDPFRYVWDGWLSSQGINPYSYVPADPSLERLHGDVLFRRLNSPFFYSIYPPLSQLVFLPAGRVHGLLGWPASFFVLKGTILLLESVGLVLILRALRRAGRPLAPFALYAWNPLVLIAVAGNAHTEGAMVLGAGLLLWALTAGGAVASWMGVAVAGMVKLIPFAWSFLLLRFSVQRWGRRTGVAVVSAACLSVGLLIPFWFSGLPPRVASSAELYVRHFEFNAGLYFLLKETALRWMEGDPGQWLGPGLRGVFLAWLAVVSLWHRAGEPTAVTRGLLLVTTGYLVTATTVHPWYLLWLLPFVPFTTLLRPAWTWASFAAFGTYFSYLDAPDPHSLHLALTAFVWGGFLLFVALEAAPSVYDGLLRWAGRRKARMLAPHIRGGSVLDLGAGEAYVADALRRSGLRVTGADVVPMRQASIPYVVYDGRALPFPTGAFDHVILSLVLHHAEDPGAVVREALRVSRGTVVVTESTYRSSAGLRVLTLLDRAVNRFRGDGSLKAMEEHLHFRTVEEWRALFAAAGARVAATRWLNRTLHRYILFELEAERRPTAGVPGGTGGGEETPSGGEEPSR